MITLPNIIMDRSGSETATSTFTYELTNNRCIYMVGKIDSESSMSVVSQIHTLSDLSSDDITLFINSGGGSVSDGLAIIDAMNTSRCDVSTICTGVSASMAAIVLACGTPGKRLITPMAEVMIHQPMGGVQGQASDISTMCEHILKVKNNLATILADRTGRSKKKVLEDFDRDYWMDAKEAKSYGIIDSILS